MKYSVLTSGYKLTASGPFTPDGEWFDHYEPDAGKASHLLMSVPNEEFDDKLISASELPDMLSIDDLNLCVSERGWATLQGLRLDPGVNALTVIVHDLEERPLANFKYLWSSAKRHPILDRSRMGIEDFASEDLPEPSEWVLDVNILPPFDLFFSETRDWIVTDRLRRACKATSLSNVKFKSIGR